VLGVGWGVALAVWVRRDLPGADVAAADAPEEAAS
jgi:hypothetical protein